MADWQLSIQSSSKSRFSTEPAEQPSVWRKRSRRLVLLLVFALGATSGFWVSQKFGTVCHIVFKTQPPKPPAKAWDL